MSKPKYRTAPAPTPGMPGGIPYIVGNEAAERFSFYGMKTILVIFMVEYLWLMNDLPGRAMSRAEAVEKNHLFNTFVYFTPLLGAFVSDAFLGKYRTIIWLSIVYCLGHATLAFMGMWGDAAWWLAGGLVLISLGSGGIKPCVSAHVGDQFGQTNAGLVTKVFNYFYWSINLGAFVSTLLTPWLLEWYGPHWAFGVPGILMCLATIVFWMGRWKFIHVPAKGLNHFKEEFFSREGMGAFGKLAIVNLLFVGAFWALFDQTGSSWVLQAADLDRNVLGMQLLPSQIQAFNPVLILIFIPLFTSFLYPGISKVFPLSPLRKIGIGLFIMVVAFGLVAAVQERIDAGYRPSILWQLLAYCLLTASEVMVSIVALEYSYTQAPRRMKSMVVSLYLLGVASGNFLTYGINLGIQIPDTLGDLYEAAEKHTAGSKKISVEGNQYTHQGYDKTFGTEDDVTAKIEKGAILEVQCASRAVLEEAAGRIETHMRSHDWTAPTPETAQELIAGIQDPWGRPLNYVFINTQLCRISSDGPDQKFKTPWDEGIVISVSRPEPDSGGWLDAILGRLQPDQPWLDRRKEEQGLKPKAAEAEEGEEEAEASYLTREAFIGGQARLEGSPYFWLFTWIMLGTAVVYLFVARKLTTRMYLHEEEADA